MNVKVKTWKVSGKSQQILTDWQKRLTCFSANSLNRWINETTFKVMMTVYIVDLLGTALGWIYQPKKRLDVRLIVPQFFFVILKLWCSVYCDITDYTFAVTTVFEWDVLIPYGMHDEMSVKDLKQNKKTEKLTENWLKNFCDGESCKSGLQGDPFLHCLAICSRTFQKWHFPEEEYLMTSS